MVVSGAGTGRPAAVSAVVARCWNRAWSAQDLLRQTRRIYRELERYDGITRRQLEEEWRTIEAARYVALDTTDDQSGQVVGRAALDAAQQIRARWIPSADDPPS
ncbi:hypothetical protein ACGFIV_16720 [Sphaerisporangium sp. NPDC049003]|uniref:hypothetical protein n=1 Tax=Sphaerisporangium sp. NPDC049003 TaxID=3364517 RepID=UPI00371F0DB2